MRISACHAQPPIAQRFADGSDQDEYHDENYK